MADLNQRLDEEIQKGRHIEEALKKNASIGGTASDDEDIPTGAGADADDRDIPADTDTSVGPDTSAATSVPATDYSQTDASNTRDEDSRQQSQVTDTALSSSQDVDDPQSIRKEEQDADQVNRAAQGVTGADPLAQTESGSSTGGMNASDSTVESGAKSSVHTDSPRERSSASDVDLTQADTERSAGNNIDQANQ